MQGIYISPILGKSQKVIGMETSHWLGFAFCPFSTSDTLFISFPIVLFPQAAREDLPWSALTPGGHDSILHSDPSWEGSRKKLEATLQLWDLALQALYQWLGLASTVRYTASCLKGSFLPSSGFLLLGTLHLSHTNLSMTFLTFLKEKNTSVR